MRFGEGAKNPVLAFDYGENDQFGSKKLKIVQILVVSGDFFARFLHPKLCESSMNKNA